jgi:multicomponent K+:H+ antiporter subunit C
MELIFAICVGVMTSCGVYLCLRGTTFTVVIGLTLLSYAVNLFLFASGRLHLNSAPILGVSQRIADPLPQALVLTAIVIGFGMTAFLVVLAMRTCADWGNDHVDGKPQPVESSIQKEQGGHDPSAHASGIAAIGGGHIDAVASFVTRLSMQRWITWVLLIVLVVIGGMLVQHAQHQTLTYALGAGSRRLASFWSLTACQPY